MNDERPISFVGETPSGTTTEEIHEFDHPGVITRAKVVTHRGQRYALQTEAELIRQGSRVTLWESLDQKFIAGNGQVYDLPVRFEFEEGDRLRLASKNVNAEGHDYHHNVTLNIDYETGVFERLTNGIRRVL